MAWGYWPVESTHPDNVSDDERRHLCELDLDRSAVLLPPGCYLNHSCDPDTMRSGVRVFAWQDVHRGDEITIDYRLNVFDENLELRLWLFELPGYGDVELLRPR